MQYTQFTYNNIEITCGCKIEPFQDESGESNHLSLITVWVGNDEQNIIELLKEFDVDRIQAMCVDELL
jgi:hypothetical protein